MGSIVQKPGGSLGTNWAEYIESTGEKQDDSRVVAGHK